MDETYIKIQGQWKYLYRAVDTDCQRQLTVCWPPNGTLQPHCTSFARPFVNHGEPEVMTIDKSSANTAAFSTLNADKPDEGTITVRQSQYLNNFVEQDHRNIKRRIYPMPGFKSFRRAQTLLAGIAQRHMIRKGQYQHPQSEGLSSAEKFYLLVA